MAPVHSMRGRAIRALVVAGGRLLALLTALLDPGSLVLRVMPRGVPPPDPLAIVLLLGLVGGALYLWARREPPD